ncbi:MAG: c-type cytochrome [Parahaliea sp.]
MIRKNIVCVVMLIAAAGAAAVELSESERAEIAARIAPIGDVCLQGDDSCGGVVAATAEPAVAAARSGKEVYDAACFACHATGAAGAPIQGNADSWAPHIAKGIDTLHNSGLHGVPGTGMMAKGGCMACSDEEVINAVDYMVEGSQ